MQAIDSQIEACWLGWKNSLRDEGYLEEEHREDDNIPGGTGTDVIKTKHYKRRERKAKRDGSVVWMQEIRMLREQRIKILGLYEAEKFQIDWRQRLEEAEIPDDGIEHIMAQAEKAVEEAFKNTE